MLISISLLSHIPFSPLSSPLLSFFFLSGTLPVSLYEYSRVSFKSKDMGAVGRARGAADTPLPHPRQLLNLCNRIISAKVAALFVKKEKGKWRQAAESVRQFIDDIRNCLERFRDEFLLLCIDPISPLLNPTSQLYFSRHAQRAVTISA